MNTTLNLVYPEKSQIGYEIAKFPDGHKHIKLKGDFNKHQYIDIVCRICNADDQFILLQIKDILNVNDVKTGRIIIYYLFTMRCDRRFTIGEANDLKLISTILKDTFGNGNITLIDPHVNIDDKYIELFSTEFMISKFKNYKDYRPCFPDEGARKRYLAEYFHSLYGNTLNKFVEYIENKKPICCEKKRAKFGEGEVEYVTVNEVNKWKRKRIKQILVVDDLIDGGKTFVEIAKELRGLFPNLRKLSLFVTHAIQITGIVKVADLYDEVFITDSYKTWSNLVLPENVKMLKIDEVQCFI